MRSLPFPRRNQLVKLLRSHGLRDVERLREDELRDALNVLQVLAPIDEDRPSSSSSSVLARGPATPLPPLPDTDDPHALPRFQEPKLFLPERQRTFLRAIAVKPRLLFVTWDVATEHRAHLEGAIQLWLFDAPVLGEELPSSALTSREPVQRQDIDLDAHGWYFQVPSERLAVACALVVMGSNRRLATSNVALMPPARPAPPGPLWMATLPPHVSRRRLARGELMRALREGTPLPEGASILHVGQADARPDFDDEDETVPSSGARPRRAILAHAVPSRGGPQPSSHSLPSSGSLSSGSFASASYAGASSSSDTLARGPLASSSAYAAGMSPLAQPSSQPFASQEETSPMNATPSPGRGSKEGER